MKEVFDKILKDDLTNYEYLLTKNEKEKYFIYKLEYAGIGLVVAFVLGYQLFGIGYLSLLGIVIGTFVGYKIPFILLMMRHKQKRNDIVDAVPIWINMLYSLIGENNIHNAIIKSYDEAPKALKPDLLEFIEKIKVDQEDKNAYMDFLKKYDIEGIRDIMMKLYEFRKLSKEKLKYEMTSLNSTLGKLEKMKRERRFKGELFTVDTLVMLQITIPCMYLFYISILLSDVMM